MRLTPEERRQMEAHIKAESAVDRLAEIRPRWLKAPHDNGQRQFLESRHKIRVAIPGNGWGKTTTMAMALDMAIQKDDPFNPDLVPRWPVVAIWVCQKFQQMDILRRQLEEEVWTRPYTWNQTRHFYSWPNGSIMYIVSADSNWEDIQGISVDFVCFDEHPDRKIWNELMWRRRGKRKTRYMVAATMTLGKTWFITEVVKPWEDYHKKVGLTGFQARKEQKHPTIWVWDKGGIRDNPIMTDEDYQHYESISSASAKELRVRLEGGYADFTGDSVFDQASLDEQIKNVSEGTNGCLEQIDTSQATLIVPDGYEAEPLLRQRIRGVGTDEKYVQWLPEGAIEGGRITVWEPPNIGDTYVLGADFAAGLIGRDYDTVIVMKKGREGTCEQVAEARGWWGDQTMAEVMFLMACWYFNAFIVGERQFGLPTLRRLYDEYHYPYIYRGRQESHRSRRPSDMLGHHRSPGDTIIPNLRSALKRGHIIVRSTDLLEELRQYQFRPKHTGSTVNIDELVSEDFVTGAPPGMNDDLVLALAYAWHAAKECGRFRMPEIDYARGTYGSIFQNARVLRGLPMKKDPMAYLHQNAP